MRRQFLGADHGLSAGDLVAGRARRVAHRLAARHRRLRTPRLVDQAVGRRDDAPDLARHRRGGAVRRSPARPGAGRR